ncbi:mechanosensitive ion channel domain-containing protein [Flavivirga abyssicola]|uniref:mechanosensitive ion channel family protein n=1 Tax=Flavivirga abyssicola TaxID=3063533 RepID=UPI0026E03128|nr:mechanosensitive ion channel domain-containing protein [Flavivirga sp. MEBiC07777]WVK12332.1 mechanosensitive ion channel domain-containing protein [Flavivirga sp. MEBiC07777]
MNQNLENIEETITKSSIWENFTDFIGIHLYSNEAGTINITVGFLLLVCIFFVLTNVVLSLVKRLITRKLPKEDKAKFTTVFSFSRWFIYLIVLLIAFSTAGINVNAILAASAGLLIGVGLALQTLFQDIISGIFILIDQSVHVGDIIELEGKVGRVEEIKLRTTRAVTIDNKVLVIPNHLYLTNSLYNWTQNGTITRESVEVGVAYGSDVELVKKLLLQVASENKDVLNFPEPLVLFTNFADSSLNFKLIVTINDSFQAVIPKSDLRFSIDKIFRENNITIPFPQRDIHVISQQKEL